MALIKSENTVLKYGSYVAVRNLNFSIEKGDYLCIVGENGAGKSTLIKGLLGLKKPSSGSIVMGDGLKHKEIGYLPQQNPVQQDFPASVFEVVLSGCLNKMGLKPFFSKKEKMRAEENMEKLSITDIAKSCYRELSGGQQRRVLLARALCSSSKLILLDEPATGLDPLVTRELYEIIKDVNTNHGISVIMVSHDIKSSIDYANKILHVRKEQLFFGETSDYVNSDLGRLFLGTDGQRDYLYQ